MEMWYLRKIQGKTRKDKIINEMYRKQLNIAAVVEAVRRENLYGWDMFMEWKKIEKSLDEPRQPK